MAQQYTKPTRFINSDHPDIVAFSEKQCGTEQDEVQKAVALYYAVRDTIRYDPYSIVPDRDSMIASNILKKGKGYCVAKAVVLAACLRHHNIPARLGFADVKNHLNTKRLHELMGTDLFVYHGYTDIYLKGRWVKATPAFNLELCNNFGVKPLEFNGNEDSIFHPFDNSGNRHMEYVTDHGTFEDLPWDILISAMQKQYPRYFEKIRETHGDFTKEALKAGRF
jgi:transglutaminase-like putative cysteine protease